MGISLDVSGFKGAFERLRDKSKEACSKAVEEHMRDVVFPETQVQVPKATGALAGTGELRRGRREGGWAVHYGNSPVEDDLAVDYAAAVHEILEHHHEPPTKVKFVEEPLRDSVPQLKERAAKKLDELAQG